MFYQNFKDMKISALGLGGLRFPAVDGSPDIIDREKGQRVVDKAFRQGINYIDTAHSYQDEDSERFLGEALSKYPRDSYYLATKFYVYPGADIEAIFNSQLERLQTDYFDVYMFHCLDEETIGDYIGKDNQYLRFLQEQKRQGRIRNLGFSSHAAPQLLEEFLSENDDFDMALIQLNYVDWTLLKAKEQYEILCNHNIPVWVMEPLKGGRLSTLNDKAVAILNDAAPGRDISSWGFRFLMGLDNVKVVLSGMSTAEQVVANAKTFEKCDPLSEGEKKALEEAIEVFLEDLGEPCSACRYCCKTCPAGLDIPLLIQGYNEQKVSGETWRVPSLGGTKPASECLQCGECLKHCPQNINIPEIMKLI